MNVGFEKLFVFADVAFPRFVYAEITSETASIGTFNNVAVFVTDASLRTNDLPFVKVAEVSHFPIHSQGLSLTTTHQPQLATLNVFPLFILCSVRVNNGKTFSAAI
jgi:hypothetical protein